MEGTSFCLLGAGAPRKPLVVVVGVQIDAQEVVTVSLSLMAPAAVLPGAPLAPEGKSHGMAFKTLPESSCFLEGLPDFLSPKQTSGLTYELRVSCILRGQKSLFLPKTHSLGNRAGHCAIVPISHVNSAQNFPGQQVLAVSTDK